MGTFTVKHDLACDAARFWKLYFDTGFNETLFKALQFPEWTQLELDETESAIVRKVKATPKLDAPAAVGKLLGSSFGYEETVRFDKAKQTLSFVMRTNVLTDKLRTSGTLACEPRGEGKCVRVVENHVEAKVFGLGGMIESSFEKSFRTGWQQSADFINKWVKEHP